MELNRKALFKSFLLYLGLLILIELSSVFSKIYLSEKSVLTLAGIWMLLTIPIYILSKKIKYLNYTYSVFNALIAGVAIGSYYSFKAVNLDNIFFWIVGFCLAMVINHWLIVITNNYKKISLINIILSLIGMGLTIYLLITLNSSLGTYLLFLTVIYLCFFIALYLNKEESFNYLDLVNFASLLMFGGVFLIILIIITEGDGVEFLDMSWWKDGKRRT
ncbi:hypothetical protein BX659_1581 [Orenia metallireducens]|uniref:Uncharacterized protein n=1 Tax=Orenia metallireducens TaxID=1413210 RepID=A0A285IIE1_9FIRM|nr:hypothetical protein [Orenia metallireducens]PRX16936.1 hypothetical protein BX659_1581 [Orenia metallireducens]SNY47770.1 hypothetical protein SAMN06265827_1581 [Orenia metallireducens]